MQHCKITATVATTTSQLSTAFTNPCF